MLFFNFLCLLYLMVLSNSHTISKSIDTDDGIDEVSDTIINLDNPRHHRIRRERFYQKHRIQEVPKRKNDDVTKANSDSKAAKIPYRPYSDLITFNVTTANPTYRSHKRKIGSFWHRFKATSKTTNKENVRKRQIAMKENADDNESLYYRPNKKKVFNFAAFEQPDKITEEDLEITVDVPVKKKHNVKFVFTPYVMYASKLTPSMIELMGSTIDESVNTKTTDSVNTAIAEMNTQLKNLKNMYSGQKKQTLEPTKSTTPGFPRTAEIEEILTGIKMKAIQTVVENAPSMIDIISNTVTETTYSADHIWDKKSTPYVQNQQSTLYVDNVLKELNEYSNGHNVVIRAATSEPLSIANIEDMLEKEIKNIYHKMKFKVAKETTPNIKSRKTIPTKTTTVSTTTTAPMKPITTTAPPTTATSSTTPIPTNAAVAAAEQSTSTKKLTVKCKVVKEKLKPQNKAEAQASKPPQNQDKTSLQDALFTIDRLERDTTSESSTVAGEVVNTDDYHMLNLYELLLQKVQEDNAMKLIATANLPSNLAKHERYRLSKRNPETLTDIELKEAVQTMYNDGIIIPDYDVLKTLSTPSETDMEKLYEVKPNTSYEDLSKKIAYDDFVNGYKHYLKFQQEKAKEDNFSAMVKYQAHRHHNVDDIGKYILDKIPQLPVDLNSSDTGRKKRYFDDMDLEDQEVSTKTDDSWFRKHFYIFLDYGPPKKFHTSQVVSLKPPIAESLDVEHSTKMASLNMSTSVSSVMYKFVTARFLNHSHKTTPSTINFDSLTRYLDAVKSTLGSADDFDTNKINNEDTTIDQSSFESSSTSSTTTSAEQEQTKKQTVKSTRKPMNLNATLMSDRHKRANDSVSMADDFVTKDFEDKSATPAKSIQAEVTIHSKSKSGNKFGYVDVNLVPTNSIQLPENNTKAEKKSKLRDFFKKFKFKSMKKKKSKRACTGRSPRFNPFKSLKNIIFKPTAKTIFTTTTTPFTRPTTTKPARTKGHQLLNPNSEKSIMRKKTTKVTKNAMDIGEAAPMFSGGGNFSFSEAMKTTPPDTPSFNGNKLPNIDMSSEDEKLPSLGTFGSQMGKLPSVSHFPSEARKLPSFESFPLQPGKVPPLVDAHASPSPSTFLMMMDNGHKSVVYVQPETVHKSTRHMKPPKRKTTPAKTMKPNPKSTKPVGDVISVNVRTPPSIVMKAVTSSVTNETLPDLNLEIAKMQYRITTTDRIQIEEDYIRGTKRAKISLVEPSLHDLTFTDQLTRFAKVSLPKYKRMEASQEHISHDNHFKSKEEHATHDYGQETMENQEIGEKSGDDKGVGTVTNVDYFNDLLVWDNDILNIDKVPQPPWKDLVKNVEKELGSTEYSPANIHTLMNELKELDSTDKKTNKMNMPKPINDKDVASHHSDEGLVRRIVLNDKALVQSKDLIIKGEQQYFQYNRPDMDAKTHVQELTPIQLPVWCAAKPCRKLPITWIDSEQKEPSCAKHTVIKGEKHISFNDCKLGDDSIWKIKIPVIWTPGCNDPKPLGRGDCLSKIAKKFYFGAKPKCGRLHRLSSSENENKVDSAEKARTAFKLQTTKAHGAEELAKNDKLTDTPALMVDTTLLSYDDEVETVTNGIDVKKLSRSSQKAGKFGKSKSKPVSKKPSPNVVAKTSTRPQMYYSTPLPMKPSDFNKFLKEQGMDIESLISPIYGQNTLIYPWSSPSKSATMSFEKVPHHTLLVSPSSAFTKLATIVSKYSTRIDKFRHKAKDKMILDQKTNQNKKAKSKSNANNKLEQPLDTSQNLYRKKRSYEVIGDQVIERPYLSQDYYYNPHRRMKKLKLFRKKYVEHETPRTEPVTEEMFSPELQAKLSHLQEEKRITVPKCKPKSGTEPNSKLFAMFDSRFPLTADRRMDVEKDDTAKTTTTERATIVSTLAPADDSDDTPAKLSGSIIFSTEDPQNKDADITIINFEDVKKHDREHSGASVGINQKVDYARLKPESVTQVAAKMKPKQHKKERPSPKSEIVNGRFDTLDSSYRLTTKMVSNADKKEIGRVLIDKKLKQAVQGVNEFVSTTPMSPKRQNGLHRLEKLRRNHHTLHPKRIQISSHHYSYDILYKIPDASKEGKDSKDRHHKMKRTSVSPASATTNIFSTLKLKHLQDKSSTPKGETAPKAKESESQKRRWVTIGSSYRYRRKVHRKHFDEDARGRNEEFYDNKNLEKRFFTWGPKLNFVRDKLSFKRMSAVPNSSTILVTSASGRAADFKDSSSKDETTASLDDLFKSRSETDTSVTKKDKLQDSLEGFRIKFGPKTITDAIEKIKAMNTDEPADPHSTETKYEIPGKFGFIHTDSPKKEEDYHVLSKPTGKEFSGNEITVKFNTNSAHMPNPVINYEDVIQEAENGTKSPAEKAASKNFENSIFDKSMYGKTTFNENAFEKAIFKQDKLYKPKNSKSYAHLFTDIMSYDITGDREKAKTDSIEYDESSMLPEHVTVDNPATFDVSKLNNPKNKNYIFDSASIIYNKSYLHHFGVPLTKLILSNSEKKEKENVTEKSWLPGGNTLSVLFRNPLEGHLGFGTKPMMQGNQPKPPEGLTLQVTPVPTPMEVLQSRFTPNTFNRQWPGGQMPMGQGFWPQMQASSGVGFPQFQNALGLNGSDAYGIYVEPGILNYDYSQPFAPFSRERFYVDPHNARSEKKNAKQYFSKHFQTKPDMPPNVGEQPQVAFRQLHRPEGVSKNPFSMYIKTYSKNKNASLRKSDAQKHNTETVQTITSKPADINNLVKRDVPSHDTYTAKDVAALEVIVDLMKNTLGYEEKDIGSVYSTIINHPMKSVNQPHDTTNSIQVHIAIPYDMQNSKKRSPLEPVRVRKVFSAKMSTPVDLEYQVHSFEGGSIETPTSTAANDDGLSPGMYLLIDKPKNGYALKPVKTNIDFAELKSRQAGNIPVTDLKGETTLRHDSIKNLAKVTLSKNFISAVNRQLVELYENLTKTSYSHKRKRRYNTQTTAMMTRELPDASESLNRNYRFRRVIDWEAVKKYFGCDRVCNCKCKANKPMCRACAASDAVIDELTFEFDNLGKYVKDHCTEIQTYFWINPSGGLKLRNAVDRIDESLRDYYKRSKGKCKGRTCEALGKQIEKRQFVKSAQVPRKGLVKTLVEDFTSVADDLNKLIAMETCFNPKLPIEGTKLIQNINACISQKSFGKRSDGEATKKKFVKNVYSLDNINVNIICHPDVSPSTELFETSTMHSMATVATQKVQEHTLIPENFFDFDIDNLKNHNKRKGFRRLFLKRNNKHNIFTYYTVADTKTPKIAFKREANDQIEMPIVADSGGSFWLEYLKASTTSQPPTSKDPMMQKETTVDATEIQTNNMLSNNNENPVSGQTASDAPNAQPASDSLPENLGKLLNFFETFLETKKNKSDDFATFSEKFRQEVTAKIKSVKPNNLERKFSISYNQTSRVPTKPSPSSSQHESSKTKMICNSKKSTKIMHNTNITCKIPSIKHLPNEHKEDTTVSIPSSKYTSSAQKASTTRKSDTEYQKYSNTTSNTTSPANVPKNSVIEGNLPVKPEPGDTVWPDTESSDLNVTERNSTTKHDKISADIFSPIASPGYEFNDSLNVDSNTTGTTVSSASETVVDSISSDIVPQNSSNKLFNNDASQNIADNVAESDKEKNVTLPSNLDTLLNNPQKDVITNFTMNLLYAYTMADIEDKLAGVQSHYNFEPTSSDKAKYQTNQNKVIDQKRCSSPAEFFNKYFYATLSSKQRNQANQGATTMKTASNTPTDSTTSTNNDLKSISSNQEFTEKLRTASNVDELTSMFYVIGTSSPGLGHSDLNTDKVTSSLSESTTSRLETEEINNPTTLADSKIVMVNEYEQLADNQNENEKQYKNLLLSIIQYETNKLNDEWQKIAYADDKGYGYKRSATVGGSSSWQSTFRSNVIEDNESPEPKKKGLLNKLVSKIGMKVVSAKKKVAHSSAIGSVTEALREVTVDFRKIPSQTTFSASENEVEREKLKNTLKGLDVKSTGKPKEASHLYPSSRIVCDIQATFNHVLQRRQDLPERTFAAYAKDIPCFKYTRLQKNFLITRKTRIPKWDWIRNKRSLYRFGQYKGRHSSDDQFCEKFEMFVKGDDGIYRITERKKRDTSKAINKQLRHLPQLKPAKNELYVMAGDSVSLDCPLQAQRSTYSQYIWVAYPKELVNCDNVRVDGLSLLIKKVGPRNAGWYSCNVDGIIRKSTKVSVVALPTVDVVFLPTYKTSRDCNYEDLKSMQELAREMSDAIKCGNVCSIRIDEPMCQKDRATNRSLIKSTGVLSMSPRRIQCSVQCRRDLFSSLLRLAIGNIPAVANTKVVVCKDGVNNTLKPIKYHGRPMITHTLRKKDSSGHSEYHKFSSVAEPGQMNVVTLCDPGYYLIKEQHICAPCPVNTSSLLGDNVCTPCAPGSIAPPGAAKCHSIIKRLRRYDWWWYPPCGYVLAFSGLVCACGVCVALALIVHLGSRGVEVKSQSHCDRISLQRTVTKPHLVAAFMHSPRARPLSPSRVILARFFKPSLPSSRGTVVDSQETRFELWKEKNIPPSLPDIDFDIDTS